MTITRALNAIRRRRQHQVSKGHSVPQDVTDHKPGVLALAAAAHLAQAGTLARDETAIQGNSPPSLWPFPADAWKPGTYEENLIEAGAFVVAELERLHHAR